MQEHTVNDIYYRTNDFVANRPTILFVHGLSGSSSAWFSYEPKFENDFNVVTYDIRGHGKSRRYAKYADYAFEEFTADVDMLIQHLNLKNFYVVSHSFATLFMLEYILKHQDNIAGAIFLSPSFAVKARWLEVLLAPIVYIYEHLLPQNESPKRGHVDYAKLTHHPKDWDIQMTYLDVVNTGLKPYLFCTKHACACDMESVLHELTIPTLIIHGRNDSIFPVKHTLRLGKKIPNAEIVVIENADHILVLNGTEELSPRIRAFVTQTSARA